jgi:hypothetical protein
MTTTTITAALIGAMAILPATAAQSDLNGTWVLDVTRSEGLPPNAAPTTLTVRQSGNRVEVEMVVQTPNGPQTIPDLYVLDGKEADFRPPVSSEVKATGKRTSRPLASGSGFESRERATLDGPEGEVTIRAARKWTLAPGGDTLTLEITFNGPQGEMKSKRVFTRQQASD